MTTDTNPSPDESPFARLVELRDEARRIDQLLYVEAVRLHEEEHHSWKAMGNALGVTRQTTWERWGKRRNRERAEISQW